MKSIIFSLYLIMAMSNPTYENLLGKHLSDASAMGMGPISSEDDMHWAWDSELQFIGKSYNHITLITNEDKTIKNITLYIPEIIDNSFYERICQKYGAEDRILVFDKLISEEKEVVENQRLEDRKHLLKDGSFEDRPFYLYWNKNDFQVRVCLDYNNQMTTILFRRPTKEL